MDPNSIEMKKIGGKTIVQWTIDEILNQKN